MYPNKLLPFLLCQDYSRILKKKSYYCQPQTSPNLIFCSINPPHELYIMTVVITYTVTRSIINKGKNTLLVGLGNISTLRSSYVEKRVIFLCYFLIDLMLLFLFVYVSTLRPRTYIFISLYHSTFVA